MSIRQAVLADLSIERNGKAFMPISVQAHHSFVDGLHVGHFVEELQKYLNEW